MWLIDCASGGNRTRTRVAANRILSPACLPVPPPRRPKKKSRAANADGTLSERPGSNRPPRPWQGRALPNELLSRFFHPPTLQFRRINL